MFNFFKNKSSVFLILVITFSISLSSFSNTFSALSGALFNAPKASAGTTGITLSGYTSAQNYSLCLVSASNGSVQLVAGQSTTQNQTVALSTPIVGSPQTYTLSLRNGTDSCNGTVLANSATFTVYANHNTNLAVSNSYTAASTNAAGATTNASGTLSATATIYNQKAYITSNGGNASINFGLNSTATQTVVFTDPDGDNLVEAASPTVPTGFSVSGAATSNGTYTYTIYPNSTATNTLGASGSFRFSVKEQATALPTPEVTDTLVNYSVSQTGTVNTTISSSSMSSSSNNSTFYYNNNNGLSYYCQGGSYESFISNNYFYNTIVGAFCNIYWSGYFYPSGSINYYPPVSSISSSSYVYNYSATSSSSLYNSLRAEPVYTSSSIQGPAPVSLIQFEARSSVVSSSIVSASAVAVSSVANNPTSYSIIPNCPVIVNSSLNYYGGGQISLQNNSPYTSNNLSANINLPTGVTVYALEKGYNFYQNGNNLNISFPEVGAFGEISTSYKTNYLGSDYNSSAVINCNQVTNPPISSIVSSSSTVNVTSATQASSSRTRDQGTRDERCENNDQRRECQKECRNQIQDFRNRNNESNGERNNRERRERNCRPEDNSSSLVLVSSSSVATLPDCPEGAFPDENACYCPSPKTITYDPTPVGGNDHSHYCKLVEVTPEGLPICNDEVVIDVNSCICPIPRTFVDTSAEADHYHICKVQELVAASSSSSAAAPEAVSSSSIASSNVSISVSLVKPAFCESPNLVLSADQKLCICPKAGELIYIVKDANGKEESVCRATSPEVATSSSISSTSSLATTVSSISSSSSTQNNSSSTSSQGFKGCEDADLVLTDDGKLCKCPTAGELIYIKKDASGKEDSVCSATDPFAISSSSSVSTSSSSSSIGLSSIEAAPLALAANSGGVITIGGIGGSTTTNSVSNATPSDILNSTPRLSGQLSARDIPTTCEDSVKINGVCPSQGTLDARQIPANATAYDMFSIDDPYTCGGNLKGKVMNTKSQTVKYEFFKNGSATPAFSYDVPVKADGTFELVIDYNVVQEDTYKIVYSATNNSGMVVSNSIEEFVTNNCTGVNALTYYANKTVRTGGQGLTPILMVVFGLLVLVGVIRFALAKPRIN
jgi:hypothetical protein